VFTARGRAALLDGLGVLQGLERELEAAIGARTLAGLRRGIAAVLAVVERPEAPQAAAPAAKARRPAKG
jgi:hypothetical protein